MVFPPNDPKVVDIGTIRVAAPPCAAWGNFLGQKGPSIFAQSVSANRTEWHVVAGRGLVSSAVGVTHATGCEEGKSSRPDMATSAVTTVGVSGTLFSFPGYVTSYLLGVQGDCAIVKEQRQRSARRFGNMREEKISYVRRLTESRWPARDSTAALGSAGGGAPAATPSGSVATSPAASLCDTAGVLWTAAFMASQKS